MADLASRITKPDAAAAPAPAAAEPAAESSAIPQTDGADDGGNSGLLESSYDVEVQLGDPDTDSPLSSISSFSDLGLYAPLRGCCAAPSHLSTCLYSY